MFLSEHMAVLERHLLASAEIAGSSGHALHKGDAREAFIRAFLSNGGGAPGYRSYILRVMDSQLTVIMLTNCDCTRGRRDVVEQIARFYDPFQ